MEWPDTKKRHEYIKAIVDSGIDVLAIKHHEIAQMFGCSESAIKADIVNYTSNRGVIIIYALCDPGTNEVRYVGQTAWKLETRVTAHIRDSLNGREKNVAKREWLKSLSANRKRPLGVVLERCEACDADGRERFWIEHYSSAGLLLTNIVWQKGHQG